MSPKPRPTPKPAEAEPVGAPRALSFAAKETRQEGIRSASLPRNGLSSPASACLRPVTFLRPLTLPEWEWPIAVFCLLSNLRNEKVLITGGRGNAKATASARRGPSLHHAVFPALGYLRFRGLHVLWQLAGPKCIKWVTLPARGPSPIAWQ